MLVVKGLQEKGFVVGSLIFDGCLVEKNDALDKEFPELEKLNNFICGINYPSAYGLRFRTDQLFSISSNEIIKDKIRAGFEPIGYKLHPVCWKNSNLGLEYDRFVFEPN